jgi:hypothetical protein
MLALDAVVATGMVTAADRTAGGGRGGGASTAKTVGGVGSVAAPPSAPTIQRQFTAAEARRDAPMDTTARLMLRGVPRLAVSPMSGCYAMNAALPSVGIFFELTSRPVPDSVRFTVVAVSGGVRTDAASWAPVDSTRAVVFAAGVNGFTLVARPDSSVETLVDGSRRMGRRVVCPR